MKILKEGDRGYALSPDRGRVSVVYQYRPLKLEETGVTVQGVLVGVDPETDEVLTVPAQSVPKLKAAREPRREKVMSVRVPNELDDVLHLIAEHYGRDVEGFVPALIRYYMISAISNEGLVRRLERLARSPLATGKARKSLRLRVRPEVHAEFEAVAAQAADANMSDLVRGAIVAAKEDILDGRARKRAEQLGAVALAV